jgi:predicted dehydrogenase
MNAYRAGLVGCGRIGALWETDPAKPLTHAGALSLTPGVQLVAGCSRDSQLTRLRAAGHL